MTATTSSASPWPRPASVSSSSRMRGWPASARASSISRSSLVVSSPAMRSAIAVRPTRAIASAASRLCLGIGLGADIGADHDVVRDRHAQERTHDLEGAADAGLAQFVRLAADMSRPSSRTSPVSGRRKPLSRLNSVVLPAPFGPMMPRICVLPQLEADILHRLQAAEGRATGCALPGRPLPVPRVPARTCGQWRPRRRRQSRASARRGGCRPAAPIACAGDRGLSRTALRAPAGSRR